MSKSIGIDLGTTNSVAAIKRVTTEVLKNKEGEFITPSCVTLIKKGRARNKFEFIVGRNAQEWLKQAPENTIVAVKRLMGRSFQNEVLQQILLENRLNYRIAAHSRGTAKSVAIIIERQEFTPEEISAQILEKIRQDAESVLDDEVDFAVITVPAYFNDKQKHATRTAAALAGLKVRRLLPEPTAAAISFGVDQVKGDDARTVLVFDFGGGTFDLSVLIISGGQFIEQGKGGDMWLGGEDIDRCIMDFVLAETAREYDIKDIHAFINNQEPHLKNQFMAELKAKAEKAKISLNTEQSAYIDILSLLKDEDGDLLDVDVELSRTQFDLLLTPIIDKTLVLTRKILLDIHLTPELVDNVLMVGGSSLIPRVVQAIKDEFGADKVLVHDRPMLAIAEGAAILSHRLVDHYECPQCGTTVSQNEDTCQQCGFDLVTFTIEQGVLDIVHAAAHDYYLHLENGQKHLFIEKNTPLPCEDTAVFSLVHPDQRFVHLKFSNIVNEKEESIGDLWLGIDQLDEEELMKRDEPFRVEITLKIDENNIIAVNASLKEHPDLNVSRTISRGMSDEKLLLELEATIEEANRKNYNIYVIYELVHRTLAILKDIDRLGDPETGTVNKTLYQKIEMNIQKARRLAAENKLSKPTIEYAITLLQKFGSIIPKGLQHDIRHKVEFLQKSDLNGTYKDNIKAIDDLQKSLKSLGTINAFMEIDKAAYFLQDVDPDRAQKYKKYLDEILLLHKNGNIDNVFQLLNEIMPEVLDVIQMIESATNVIHKDIRK
ncbi:Hsp70 family protein [candidate division CSSED10-310 bacterium]|uniref:Hsp70 family protein n=1 Tax=candidate division CSSED10-310 bacterium TaxID=2855610 RepID=A0ABV6YZG7_UNCC1